MNGGHKRAIFREPTGRRSQEIWQKVARNNSSKVFGAQYALAVELFKLYIAKNQPLQTSINCVY